MNYIGIDPGGASGGLALLRYDTDELFDVQACKMPATERDIVEQLREWQALAPCRALIERVHAMPKQGVSSSFAFGRNVGVLHGALAALRIPYDEITPQRWQTFMGCMTRGDKTVTKRRAQQVLPQVEKITHATADALLLAYCAWGLDRAARGERGNR